MEVVALISQDRSWTKRESLVNLTLALGFFLLCLSWGLSSPPGSAADDEFHTASIVCATGSNQFCEILDSDESGAATRVRVPDRIASQCFFTAFPAVDASCISSQLGILSETTKINVNHNFSLFYRVMNVFLGENYESSIIMMRVFNAALFSALLFIALCAVIAPVRRGLSLMLLTVMVPFATFFIPSINPSSWTITGTVFSWIFLFSILTLKDKIQHPLQTATLLIGLIVSTGMAIGSRGDSAAYILVGAIAATIIAWPQVSQPTKWVVAVAGFTFPVLAVFFLQSRLYGFWNTVFGNLVNPGKFIEHTVELPSVIAGIIGGSAPFFRHSPFFYYGIGWHEIQMPASVGLITVATLGALVFAFLTKAKRRVIIAVIFVILMMVLAQMYKVAAFGYGEFSNGTPRYMTPLFLVAVALFFAFTQPDRAFPSKIQTLWIVSAMPVAGAIALLTTIRRYTNGQSETWFSLFFEPKWWWENNLLSPTGVWFLGVMASLILAISAIHIIRRTSDTLNMSSQQHQRSISQQK